MSEVCWDDLTPWSPVRWQSLARVLFDPISTDSCTAVMVIGLAHMSSQVGVAESLHQSENLGHIPRNAKSCKQQIHVCAQVTDNRKERGNMYDLGMSVL